MHADVAAFARKHALPAEVADDLDRWWSRGDAAATLVPESFEADAASPGEPGTDRYEDLGPIGEGGMGEVRRVRDVVLDRTLAMKIVRAPPRRLRDAADRMLDEARTTARLQHPNIVPVHDLGRLPDGRVWFTMSEVRGRTLGEVIADVHAARARGGEWPLRRLVSAFQAVCRAVAHAHERGVLHRDLKPSNVMVGPHGEVYVLDWGLARAIARLADDEDGEDEDVPRVAALTRVGQVTGTPAYMPPEQARADREAVGPWSDVYALGSMLYELLAGRPPYEGQAREVVARLLEGPPPPLTDPALPEELVGACRRAMAREPGERFPSASALAEEVEAWLEGSRRREQALGVVARAQENQPEAAELRARASALREVAAAELSAVAPWAPEGEKRSAWAKEDEASALEVSAAMAEVERDQLLHAALTHAPGLAEAHVALAADQLAAHAAAEAARDVAGASRAERLLRAHAEALPPEHPVRARATAWLRGTGALTLVTEPEGAEVDLYRYEPEGRRLVARPAGSLGRAPLVEVPLERGSWLLVLRHPGRQEVRYPVHLGRGAHWDGVRPGDRSPTPVELPRLGSLGAEDRYVPAGWFVAGAVGEHGAVAPGPRWVDAFVVRRFPVTCAAYVAFLDDLVASGDEAAALRWAPRERAHVPGGLGALIFGRADDGRFVLQPDADGDMWQPDWPISMIDFASAQAYAGWAAAREGLPWRLPGDLEWEKAARGVDGRLAPWGDGFDPSYAHMRDSLPGRASPGPVHAFPLDESVYGIRGLGGGVQDWCLDVSTKTGTPPGRVAEPIEEAARSDRPGRRIARGGAWSGLAAQVRCAVRGDAADGLRLPFIGVRLARSWRAGGPGDPGGG